MKKLIIFLIIFSFFLVSPAVLAQTNETPIPTTDTQTELTGPGVLPDSPFYFFKSLTEGVREVFVFGEDNKANYSLTLADKRLSEARALANKGKGELAAKTAEKAADKNEEGQRHVEKAMSEGKDVATIVERLAANSARQQAVLAKVLEKVPEQAKAAIQRAIEVSKRGLRKAQEMQIKKRDKLESTGKPEKVREPTETSGKPKGAGKQTGTPGKSKRD